MVVIKEDNMSEMIKLAADTGLSYSVRPFEFDNVKYCEVLSNSKALLQLVRKKLVDTETGRIFYD